MSCQTAPLGEVTTPIRRGKGGSGRLRSGLKSPSLLRLRKRRSNSGLEDAFADRAEVVNNDLQ